MFFLNLEEKKIKQKIIKKFDEISKIKHWVSIRSVTRNDNHVAKTLYGKVADKSTWEVYEHG